jgi:hypothetical protein
MIAFTYKLEPLLPSLMMLHFETPFHTQHTSNSIGGIVTQYRRNLVRARSTAPVFDEERFFSFVGRIAVCDTGVCCTEVYCNCDSIAVHDAFFRLDNKFQELTKYF